MWAPYFSSSSSSPSSSTPSSSSAVTDRDFPARPPPAAARTMEEVWRDISLVSDNLPRRPSAASGGVVILQDFLSRDPPASAAASPPPPPQLPTVLTLSSTAHHFSSLLINNNGNDNQYHHEHNNVLKMPPSDGAAMRKRFPEFDPNSGERRHKRMIKNRESAARSRARKQERPSAYTNELELEVAHLMEENAKLRQQQEQLCRDAAAQHQKRKPLHRTLTAPF
ncbi:basic leucine zipper transcription factor [Striga asiatica]|uniref:Basic leucine zipper transcription factor n=1 Tax=Striga asiatica TaxID=4170 RepID=A0A5A7P9Y3_STRAF|nr:basic leucine zipper transcription factor [Striga asiatica]